jgi:hypothetical protein
LVSCALVLCEPGDEPVEVLHPLRQVYYVISVRVERAHYSFLYPTIFRRAPGDFLGALLSPCFQSYSSLLSLALLLRMIDKWGLYSLQK